VFVDRVVGVALASNGLGSIAGAAFDGRGVALGSMAGVDSAAEKERCGGTSTALVLPEGERIFLIKMCSAMALESCKAFSRASADSFGSD